MEIVELYDFTLSFFFNKNIRYKDIETEIFEILRICPRLRLFQNIFSHNDDLQNTIKSVYVKK